MALGVNANKTVETIVWVPVCSVFVGVCVCEMFDGSCQIGRAQQEAAGGEHKNPCSLDFSPGPQTRQNQYIFKVDTPT